EMGDSCGTDDLGKGAAVSEGIGKPAHIARDAELFTEEPRAAHELSNESLATWHIRVRLHPHPADRSDAPCLHSGPDSFEEFGLGVLDPCILLRRRRGEDELWIPIDEIENIREGPCDFPHRLPCRPQPGAINVGVADSRYDQCAFRC